LPPWLGYRHFAPRKNARPATTWIFPLFVFRFVLFIIIFFCMPKETGSLAWASDHPPTAERAAAMFAATENAMLAYQVVAEPLKKKEACARYS
jgi:hypothetical protein